MGRMDGKVALITGGARGQGRSHALTLAREGADVVLLDLVADIASVPYALATPDDLWATVADVEALDRRVLAVEGDVRDQAAVDEAAARAVAELGRLDVLVSNAGIWAVTPLLEISDEEWQDQIDVNLTGHFRATRAAAPHMIAAGGGAIVYISSIAGQRAAPPYAHYTAAKHGVLGLMRTAAAEFGAHRIRCNAVCPGFIDTKMNNWQAALDMIAGTGPGTGTEAHRRDFAPHFSALAGGGLIPPQSVSDAVLYLASDDAQNVTGTTITVDDGALALPPYNPTIVA